MTNEQMRWTKETNIKNMTKNIPMDVASIRKQVRTLGMVAAHLERADEKASVAAVEQATKTIMALRVQLTRTETALSEALEALKAAQALIIRRS